MEKLKGGVHLKSGGQAEVEIRGCSMGCRGESFSGFIFIVGIYWYIILFDGVVSHEFQAEIST